jgi:hypothetical protein
MPVPEGHFAAIGPDDLPTFLKVLNENEARQATWPAAEILAVLVRDPPGLVTAARGDCN